MMKKLIFGLALTAGFALASCSTDGGENSSSVTMATANLITPLDGTAPSTVSAAAYNFKMNFTEGNAVITCQQLTIGGSTHGFVTDPLLFGNGVLDPGDGNGKGAQTVFNNFTAVYDNNPSQQVVGAKSIVTSCYYRSEYFPYRIPQALTENKIPSLEMLLMDYTIDGKYRVQTFPLDCYWKGTTSTVFTDKEGNSGNYMNANMLYRVIIDDYKKEEPTATVEIYKAKFAQQAPELPVMQLKGLKVKWGQGSYTITNDGATIIPKVLESNALQEYPSYPFNKFEITVRGNYLNDASISYEVKDGLFKGTFAGNYCYYKL